MKFEAVYLEWEDAMEYNSGWHDLENTVKDSKDMVICILIGFIIDETKDYILVSSHYIIDNINNSVGTPFKIPKAYIRKRKTLKL